MQAARRSQPNPPKFELYGKPRAIPARKEALLFGQSVNFVRSPQKNYASR
jgi:hypothetical protein